MTSFIHTKDLEQVSKIARGQKRDLRNISVNLCECVQNAIPSFTTSFFIRSWPQLLLLFYSYDVPTYVRPIVHELF